MTRFDPSRLSAGEWRALAADTATDLDPDRHLTTDRPAAIGEAYAACAAIAATDGTTDRATLVTTDGDPIPDAMLVRTRYGLAWRYTRGGRTVWFSPSRAADPDVRSERDAAKGARVVTAHGPTVVVVHDGAVVLTPAP